MNKTTIFWDFDGVIINSNEIRENGFREVLKQFPRSEVEKLISFHRINGGLSRYVKFKYFYENILGQSVSESKINSLADEFSKIMMKSMVDKNLLISSTRNFIVNNHDKYHMHIVSGSDHHELNELCKSLAISNYFKTINGSPTPKINLVEKLITKYEYDPDTIVLIGDSINDYEAAAVNNIEFLGFGPDTKILDKTNTNFKI